MSSSNFFELFQLPEQYALSVPVLDSAYREVQSQVHPDRYAGGSDAERRVAMQLATRANEAYRVLKDPLKRVIYLLELRGEAVGAESNTAMDSEFLMQQMEWREDVETAREAKQLDRLESLRKTIRREKKDHFDRLEGLFSTRALPATAKLARQLLFIEKLEREVDDAIELLESV